MVLTTGSRNMADFMNIVPNLKKAQSETEFKVWFEQLLKIDPRSLYLWIRKYKEELNPVYVDMVKDRFRKELEDA